MRFELIVGGGPGKMNRKAPAKDTVYIGEED
jgi:hypothetical protein